MSKPKFLRDPVHLQVRFEPVDLAAPAANLTDTNRASWALQKIIDTLPFQRLRGVRQNGLANLVFHGAEHSRFSHSIGVSHLARTMYERICRNMSEAEDAQHLLEVSIASLVHDVGHGPFSHTMEEILKEAGVSFHHETMTRRFILEENSEISGILREVDTSLPAAVGAFFDKVRTDDHWRYRIVSSQMDADRLDYVQRDALFAGVRGHGFDIERLLDLIFVHGGEALAVDRGALESVEAYLVTIDHLWRSIYYHHAVRAGTKMLTSLFRRAVRLHTSGDKTVFASRGDREHPVVTLLREGDAIDLSLYQRLNDASVWELVDYWRDSKDLVLSDLSERLVRRRLLKSRSLDPAKIKVLLEQQEKATELTKHWLGGRQDLVEYYMLLDDPDRTSYKRYDWKPESRSESIWLSGGGQPDRPIEEDTESKIVGALKDTRLFHRLILPQEVRDQLQT